MKTNSSVGRWSARVGIAALAVVFASTGWSAPQKSSANKHRVVTKAHGKCYVMLSSSPFPQPCERLRGLATASPMDIIGEYPPMMRGH
jgi:hypothetical protein